MNIDYSNQYDEWLFGDQHYDDDPGYITVAHTTYPAFFCLINLPNEDGEVDRSVDSYVVSLSSGMEAHAVMWLDEIDLDDETIKPLFKRLNEVVVEYIEQNEDYGE